MLHRFSCEVEQIPLVVGGLLVAKGFVCVPVRVGAAGQRLGHGGRVETENG